MLNVNNELYVNSEYCKCMKIVLNYGKMMDIKTLCM